MREDPALRDLPIIAMTANAMKSDLDACLAAGMNDFITKPIERKLLLQTLRRWLPARTPSATVAGQVASEPAVVSSAGPAGRGPNDAPPLEGINVTGSLARLGLDFGTFQKMLVRFAGSQGAMLEAVRAAVAAGDSSEVARSAHTIAGASGNLGRRGASGCRQGARTRRPRGQQVTSRASRRRGGSRCGRRIPLDRIAAWRRRAGRR